MKKSYFVAGIWVVVLLAALLHFTGFFLSPIEKLKVVVESESALQARIDKIYSKLTFSDSAGLKILMNDYIRGFLGAFRSEKAEGVTKASILRAVSHFQPAEKARIIKYAEYLRSRLHVQISLSSLDKQTLRRAQKYKKELLLVIKKMRSSTSLGSE